jgi:DNA modification methylase
MKNRLYYGDNLEVLQDRAAFPDESVDLIYLDPPFNSNANYSHLFRSPDGKVAQSQIQAFEDTWEWGDSANAAFRQVVTGPNTDVAELLTSMRRFLRENAMMAYLAMMAARLVELHRVLKPTGSLYLHCDPTASHYLKLLLDGVFGPENFRNEIIWRRTNAHSKLSKQFGPIHDVILFYSKSANFKFQPGRRPYVASYVEKAFPSKDGNGRYQSNVLTGAGVRTGDSGKPWRSYDPTPKGRHWAIPAKLLAAAGIGETDLPLTDVLERLDTAELILHPKSAGSLPRYKQYLETSEGILFQDIWAYQPGTRGALLGTDEGIDEDVKWLDADDEKLGYPTQKPLGLLSRIITSSSNPGDVVLDPFCGCGTAVDAAQKLGRHWIGIDVTHLAIGLIEKRLRDRYPEGLEYEVIGRPADIDSALRLAAERPYDFQYWITFAIDGQAFQGGRKGADRGIDGFIWFTGPDRQPERVLISVKAGQNIGPAMIRDLKGTMEREKAPMGVFVCAREPSAEMKREAAAAGEYEGPDGRFYPRVQIFTLEDLFAGRKPRVPLLDTAAAYRRAPRAQDDAAQGALGL